MPCVGRQQKVSPTAPRRHKKLPPVCHDSVDGDDFIVVSFESFVERHGRRLRAALVASFGADVGADATSEALTYGWEHWDRIAEMDNPTGYLFRVGQNAGRRLVRRRPLFPMPEADRLPHFEPALLPALAELPEQQRVSVVLVHAFGWAIVDVAELLGVSHSTIRTHLARGLASLQSALEVGTHVD